MTKKNVYYSIRLHLRECVIRCVRTRFAICVLVSNVIVTILIIRCVYVSVDSFLRHCFQRDKETKQEKLNSNYKQNDNKIFVDDVVGWHQCPTPYSNIQYHHFIFHLFLDFLQRK